MDQVWRFNSLEASHTCGSLAHLTRHSEVYEIAKNTYSTVRSCGGRIMERYIPFCSNNIF